MTLESGLNYLAIISGMVGFTVALWTLRRRSHDNVDATAIAIFVFMQFAMWGVEVFFWVTVILRLTGHGVGLVQ